MTDAATNPVGDTDGSEKKGGGLRSLLIGLVLAIVGAAGGYFAATSGLLDSAPEAANDAPAETQPTAFVEVPPMVVTLARPGGVAQLRLKLSLEVAESAAGDITALMPRLVDVLNSYLRAVETVDVGDVTTLVRLRAQMLRRVQIVAGGDEIKDLLIQEFVVN